MHINASSRGPETGLEEINGDLLEADFWPGITSVLPVIHSECHCLNFAHVIRHWMKLQEGGRGMTGTSRYFARGRSLGDAEQQTDLWFIKTERRPQFGVRGPSLETACITWRGLRGIGTVRNHSGV